jgi:uncharacterized RDD family membrane protein YckC
VLWGRPIVPDLPWVWGVVAVFFLLYLMVGLLFERPVAACAATLRGKPLTTFGVGILVLLLVGPVSLLLAVSVIGLAVVPVLLCSLVVAAIVGKVGAARWIGMSLVPETTIDSRAQALRSFAIGFVVVLLAYMVPLLGFITRTLTGVLGLGAATLAFAAAYRRELPPPPPTPRPIAAQPPMAAQEGAAIADAEEPGPMFTPAVDAAAPPAVTDLTSFPRAPFRDRLAAFVLDVILVVIAYQILDLTRREGTIFLLLLAYHIGFWAWKGTTVGGIICQLRVVRVDGQPLRFVDAFVRGLSSIFSFAVVGIGVLWILRDPERQAWHDKIAGTYVVKVPRNWAL